MPNLRSNLKRNRNMQGADVAYIVHLMNTYAEEFEINTPLRWAHYLAQIAHESGELLYTEEIASGARYEGRKDLGNTQKGDGVRYKGRGAIQLTGRANYTAYKKFCGFDVLEKPYLLCKPVGAIRSSMWFCSTRGVLKYADENNFIKVTKIINGGTNGLEYRKKYFNRACTALGIK